MRTCTKRNCVRGLQERASECNVHVVECVLRTQQETARRCLMSCVKVRTSCVRIRQDKSAALTAMVNDT
jgi:hypothetical protein